MFPQIYPHNKRLVLWSHLEWHTVWGWAKDDKCSFSSKLCFEIWDLISLGGPWKGRRVFWWTLGCYSFALWSLMFLTDFTDTIVFFFPSVCLALTESWQNAGRHLEQTCCLSEVSHDGSPGSLSSCAPHFLLKQSLFRVGVGRVCVCVCDREPEGCESARLSE